MSKTDVPFVPAHPLHVALLLTELCISAMEKGTGVSVLEVAVYSIRWAHQIAGFLSLSHVSRAPDVSLPVQSNRRRRGN